MVVILNVVIQHCVEIPKTFEVWVSDIFVIGALRATLPYFLYTTCFT